MARVTVEDCIERIPNRFALVLATSYRTKQLMRGSQYLGDTPTDNKFVVNALREIAANKVRLVQSLDDIDQIADDI
ncbi:MAG: DNA-directed RNA polymerase subunit omega [Candidatus Lernaella stagnicola]|nr:DNA-directed RNA polymerase subunit omega [Candidatus Lernaella stagnicola]